MIWTIILFFLVLSVLVLVHEWGHYYSAKKFGVKVDEFGLGFPPKVYSWKGKDGMEWSLNAIPLGGFVRIKGESGEDRQDKDSFGHKSIAKRLLILSAGVIMNVVLAWILFSIALGLGSPAIIDDSVSDAAVIENQSVIIAEVLPESPAEEAGFLPGDKIVSVNDTEYQTSGDLSNILNAESFIVLEVAIERDGEMESFNVSTEYLEEIDDLGIGVALLDTGTVKYSFYLAPVEGFRVTILYTWQILVAFYEIIANLIAGDGPGVELSGPVGIAVMTGEVASLGLTHLMQFAAILSLNLAVLNILPFPALDGGRIVFVLLEAIRRKPTTKELEAVIHNTGFILLMLLVIFVTYKDILNLFK